MTATCDVVVVGLGAVGSATAYQLAKAGADVVGIDRYAPPHALGSSHGETRITRLAVGEGPQYVPLVRRSHELWAEIGEAVGRRLLVACGGLILGAPGSTGQHGVTDFTQATIAIARDHGIDHEVLAADEIRSRFGVFEVTDEVGYFEPTAGYLLADACVAAQLELAERLGATLRRDERVLGWARRGAGVRVETDRGAVDAARLVLAAGPWLAELAPELAKVVSVQRQVQYWFDVDGDTAPFARLPVFIWLHGEATEDYAYGFPAIDGPRGGVKVATETFSAPTAPASVERGVEPGEVAQMHRAHVAGRLRALSARCVRSAVCLYTVTPDFGFVLDVLPSDDRVVVASPCSGHGFKHSAAVGECVAAMATGSAPHEDVRAFGLGRFH